MLRLLTLRPTFELPLGVSRDEAIERLAAEYKRLGERERFLMFGEYGELHLPTSEHRLWSPHLSFYVLDREGETWVHGRFAPRLEIWTMVWIVYLAMAFSAFFGLVLAYSQWAVGESMWGGYVAIAGCVVIATLYVIAQVGQQYSQDQMDSLRAQLETILNATKLLR